MSAPLDLPGYIDALEETLLASLALANALRPDEWRLPTRCPGWDVHDQVAHIVGLEAQLAGDPLPPDAPAAPHVRNRVGAHMERAVHARRSATPAELIAELGSLVERRMVQLRALGPDDEVVGVMGRPRPVASILPTRVFDVWAHEQDIRSAVGRPGGCEGRAAAVSWGEIMASLPGQLAEVEGAAGRVVGFALTGDRPARFAISTDDGATHAELDRADVVVHSDSGDFVARMCGRTGAGPARLDGDEQLGQRVLAALAMTP